MRLNETTDIPWSSVSSILPLFVSVPYTLSFSSRVFTHSGFSSLRRFQFSAFSPQRGPDLSQQCGALPFLWARGGRWCSDRDGRLPFRLFGDTACTHARQNTHRAICLVLTCKQLGSLWGGSSFFIAVTSDLYCVFSQQKTEASLVFILLCKTLAWLLPSYAISLNSYLTSNSVWIFSNSHGFPLADFHLGQSANRRSHEVWC